MPIGDDWQLNYVPVTVGGYRELVHVDGILSYDTNTGTAPSLNDYIYQASTGALGRVIAGSDLGGTAATGTLTLTNVVGRFADNGALTVLDAVNFDTVANNGFKVGDTITGPTTESLDVLAIEYNSGPKVVKDAGEGWAYGNNLVAGFANNEQIDVSGGATAVALVHTGGEVAGATFTGALANGTLAVPGTANTNNSLIIHYDAGTISIPEGAAVSDATTGAQGLVEQKLGTVAEGSLRLVDTSLTPAWTDNNNIDGEEVVFFNAQVAGEVFLENGEYEGQTSNARFQVLPGGIIDDGDSTGKLWTKGVTAALTLNEDIHRILPGDILGNKVAQVEAVGTTLTTVAVVNTPDGVRTEQLADAGVSQGGIYDPADGLNIRRDTNELFSYLKDVFDELSDLQYPPPVRGNVRDSLYTVLTDVNDWQIPDLSFRFLEKAAWQDDTRNNQWTNHVGSPATFTGADITSVGWARTSAKPRAMPNAYLEQDKVVQPSYWLEGPFDVITKVRSTTDMQAIDPATPALGQLIDGGAVVWHSRPFGRKYAVFDNADVGKAATIVLKNDADPDNATGQYRYSFNTGGAGAFTVGEEISTSDGTKRGIVTASGSGATGNVDYILLTDTQFADTDVITGEVSAKSATLDAAGLSNLVAGYGTNIRQMWVDRRFTGGTTTSGPFIIGEQVSQAGSGYDGYVLEDDGGTIYVQDAPGTAAPNGTGQLSGDTSGALNTPTAVADFTTVPKDLGEGSGDLNYAGVLSANITGGSARPVLEAYEWDKFLTNEKATTPLQGGRGTVAGVEGRLYRKLDPTFAEKQEAPYGTFSGGIMSAAEGNFIVKETLAVADLRNLRVTPIGGLELTPPNLQGATLANLQATWRGKLARSTGAGSVVVLSNEFQIGAGNAAGNSTIVVQAGGARAVSPLPSDVPNTGVVGAEDPNNPGQFLRFPYSSVNRATNTFTLTSGTIGDVTGGSALTQGDDCYAAWIWAESAGATLTATVQHIGDVDVVGIARKKGFDDFIQAQSFTDTGVTFTVNRTADGVVNLP